MSGNETKKSSWVSIILIVIGAMIVGGFILITISLQMAKYFRYEQAMQLHADGRYEEAIVILNDLRDYGHAKDMVQETKYMQAKSLMDEGEYKLASDIFRALGSYADSHDKWLESFYGYGNELLADGRYEMAESVFYALDSYGYRDSADRIKQITKQYEESKYADESSEEDRWSFSRARVGDRIGFGVWYQDNDRIKQPINWIVVAVRHDEIMLLCEDIIDCRRFGETDSWYKSELNEWLNHDFYNAAFSVEEKTYIARDTVTILDADEANEICIRLAWMNISEAECTAYAKERFIEQADVFDSDLAQVWWCKDAIYEEFCCIGRLNSEEDREVFVLSPESCAGVRPVIWIEAGE